MSAPDDLPTCFREHAAYCTAAAAPLYGVLLEAFADDWEAGGPVREICAGWEGAPRGHVVQLRLLGALHRLVLLGRAPDLAAYYRSVGGRAAPVTAWPAARAALAAHVDWVREQLSVAPQTNETGRSACLVAGVLLATGRTGLRRVRLLEIGASAGLNLLVAHFRVTGEGWDWGPPASPVDLSGTVRGTLPASALDAARRGVDVEAVLGCDLAPVDPRSAEGRLRLTSFVWPDHVERHARLAGALALARDHAAVVEAEAAASWLRRRLAEPVPAGVLTVVWHSIMRQYVHPREWAEVQQAVDDARRRGALAHLCLESVTVPYHAQPQVVLDGVPIGSAPAHGVPVTLAV